jgi:rubredoxin
MDALTFTCPECGKNKLGSVEQVMLTYPIKAIPADGDLDYDYDNPIAGDGHVLCYQCMNCGYELEDDEGNTITDGLKVFDWIKKHCSEQSH